MRAALHAVSIDAAALARLALLGDTLDHLITIDLGGRGAIATLYAAARRISEGPLTTTAAITLVQACAPGSILAICTGFPVRPWISPAIGETDGPPGAAALAWAAATALKALPVIVTPPAMTGQAEAAARAFGLVPLPLDQARAAVAGSRPTPAVVIRPFTVDAAAAEGDAEKFMTALKPVAIAAVEHPGANEHGVYHSSLGVDISAGCAKVEMIFARARAAGLLTLTFADMPNEIGIAPLQADALAASPYATKCQCPCGGGIVGASTVDQIVMATMANWAAYATAGAIAVITGIARATTTPEQDARALAATQAAGGAEGVTGSLDPAAGADGLSTAVSGKIVSLIESALRPYEGLSERPPY